MIAWVIIFGLLCILLMAPASVFGWLCGKFALAWARKAQATAAPADIGMPLLRPIPARHRLARLWRAFSFPTYGIRRAPPRP
jgi:hypothetical protein